MPPKILQENLSGRRLLDESGDCVRRHPLDRVTRRSAASPPWEREVDPTYHIQFERQPASRKSYLFGVPQDHRSVRRPNRMRSQSSGRLRSPTQQGSGVERTDDYAATGTAHASKLGEKGRQVVDELQHLGAIYEIKLCVCERQSKRIALIGSHSPGASQGAHAQ